MFPVSYSFFVSSVVCDNTVRTVTDEMSDADEEGLVKDSDACGTRASENDDLGDGVIVDD